MFCPTKESRQRDCGERVRRRGRFARDACRGRHRRLETPRRLLARRARLRRRRLVGRRRHRQDVRRAQLQRRSRDNGVFLSSGSTRRARGAFARRDFSSFSGPFATFNVSRAMVSDFLLTQQRKSSTSERVRARRPSRRKTHERHMRERERERERTSPRCCCFLVYSAGETCARALVFARGGFERNGPTKRILFLRFRTRFGRFRRGRSRVLDGRASSSRPTAICCSSAPTVERTSSSTPTRAPRRTSSPATHKTPRYVRTLTHKQAFWSQLPLCLSRERGGHSTWNTHAHTFGARTTRTTSTENCKN